MLRLIKPIDASRSLYLDTGCYSLLSPNQTLTSRATAILKIVSRDGFFFPLSMSEIQLAATSSSPARSSCVQPFFFRKSRTIFPRDSAARMFFIEQH